MALTTVDFELFMALRAGGELPERPSVLEIGESEWYGDIPTEALAEAVRNTAPGPQRTDLEQRLARILASDAPQQSWDLAKLFYAAVLGYRKISAIDLHGTPAALKLDLNQPVTLGEQFDILISGGTAEHVFNVFQFFRTCHELTRAGGLMVHSVPFLGWLEHGFYNFNPTFFWDLAQANGYTVVRLAYTEIDPMRLIYLDSRERLLDMARRGELGRNALLYAVLRKAAAETDFRAPMQGVYAGSVSNAVMEAWHTLR